MTTLSSAAIVGLVVAMSPTARADDVSYQLETSVASSYVSRGIPQYADRTVASSQNTASLKIDHVGSGSLSLVAWNAVALSEYGTQPGTALELDLSVAYAYRTGALTITSGYVVYLFPEHMDGTPFDGAHEISGILSYDNRYAVPTVSAYVEVAHQQGLYLSVGASRDLHHDHWTFSPALSVGGATYRKYLGGDKVAAFHVNDLTGVLGARRDFDAGFYATAKLSYSFCGTPSDLIPMDPSWGFEGRSTLFGVVAFGVSR
jgi:hypothetical protein